jgi:thiol-disulfide isomerase/thioredoxin
MSKPILLILVAVISLGAGVVARSGWPTVEQPKQALPAFALTDLSGKQRNMNEWRGKILIINFWATWCPPCRKEIPEFIALQNDYSAQGLQFIGIAIEDKTSVVDFLKNLAINYPILIGENDGIALAHSLGNLSDSVPFSVVVDAQGQVIHRHQGEFSRQQIVEIITPLLTDAKTD